MFAAHTRRSGFRSQYPDIKSDMITGTQDPSPVGNRDRRMACTGQSSSLTKDLVSKESSRETDKAGHPVSPFRL